MRHHLKALIPIATSTIRRVVVNLYRWPKGVQETSLLVRLPVYPSRRFTAKRKQLQAKLITRSLPNSHFLRDEYSQVDLIASVATVLRLTLVDMCASAQTFPFSN